MRGAGPIAVMRMLQNGEKYGYELVEGLEKKSLGILVMGQSTLYPMLYNLESKGLIASRVDKSGPRPRKYYRLTKAGEKRLAVDLVKWEKLVTGMRGILSEEPSAFTGGVA